MMSSLDTRIAFFGGAANQAALEAVRALADAGYSLVVGSHDPRESVFLQEANIPFASSRVEALAGCQIVITSVRTPKDVEELYLGENGLLELMKPGTYAIDVSFSTPGLAREIQAVAAVSDIDAIDAPIVNLGEKEQSIMFLGGMPETHKALSPLLPFMAETVLPQTDAGEGQFAAAIAYIALAGSIMGAIEAMALTRIAGYADNAAIGVLASTAGGSRALVDFVPRLLARDYTGAIRVADFLDALEVALDAAEDLDVTLPMVETAFQLYDLLSVVGGDELSIQALSLLYEDEKTCARYGLDWALADSMQHDAGYGDYGYDDAYGDEGDMGPGPGFPGHGRLGPHGGHGGTPPIDGFFSRN